MCRISDVRPSVVEKHCFRQMNNRYTDRRAGPREGKGSKPVFSVYELPERTWSCHPSGDPCMCLPQVRQQQLLFSDNILRAVKDTSSVLHLIQGQCSVNGWS